MKDYWISITEYSRMYVCIEATNEQEAKQIAKSNWKDGEYLIDSGYFLGTAYDIVPESETVKMEDYDYRTAKHRSEMF